ncbi:AAA family ATPase [Nonomuraea rubra]|uniref:AAA family ATPase n=1 Tax=Nonomuraea rubra TaxID=46180 RepID=UPI003619D056
MNPGQAIVGRDGEREKLSAFLAAPQGQALVLRGETGVGKSALLDHAAALATPAHDVIRAAGVEAESELPYAGLHQLLHPLLPRLSGLDDGHRAAFDVAFGLRQGGTPSVMSLGIAVLDLLSLASSGGPLLLLLDDGQWLDASSIEVCGFVGRRLAGSAVKMLIAVRSDVGSRFDTAALPELTLPPLPDEAAGRLLDLRHPGLSPRTRRLVLEHAMGNALALVELPPYVEAAGFGSVPLSRRLQHVYGLRIERLAAPVREELLRGALDGVGAGQGGNRSPAGATACATPARRWRPACWTPIPPPASSSSGTRWSAPPSSSSPRRTSAARRTRTSPGCTRARSSGTRVTWRPRGWTPTRRWRPRWRRRPSRRPGAAARWRPWPG